MLSKNIECFFIYVSVLIAFLVFIYVSTFDSRQGLAYGARKCAAARATS